MASCRYGVFPWIAESQLYCDFNKQKYKQYASRNHFCVTGRQESDSTNNKITYRNKLESYWDQKTFGQLSCKSGSFKNQQGDEFESLDNDGDPTYIYCLKFCPKESSLNVLAMGSEEGIISFLDTSRQSLVKNEFQAHQNAIFDIAWVPGTENKVISVSGDMTARLWDADRGPSENEISVFKGHGRSVKCIAFKPNMPNEFATGSRENSILLWDIRDPSKPNNTIRDAHAVLQPTLTPKNARRFARRHSIVSKDSIGNTPHSSKGSVTTMQFQDDNTLISASDLDGIIKIWDLRRSYDLYSGRPKPKCVIPYAGQCTLNGYSGLLLDSSRTKLYASCKDHSIYLFDVGQCQNKSALKTFVGHTNGSKFFVRISLSEDNRYLVSGSSDGLAYVWNTNLQSSKQSQDPIATLKGHEAEVTCVEFSKDKLQPKLATCSDDMKCKIWRTRSTVCSKSSNISEAPVASGEVSWNNKNDPYLFGQPFEDKIQYDYPTIIHTEIKSKRKLFCDVIANDENRCQNFQQNEAFYKKRKLVEIGQEPVRFAAYPSSSPNKMTNVLISPRKVLSSSTAILNSPRKLNITPKKDKDKILNSVKGVLNFYPSPTGNMPNIILDGRSPHEKSNSARSRGAGKMKGTSDRKVDWLTEMGQQKKHQQPKKLTTKEQQVTSSQNSQNDSLTLYSK